MDNLWNEIATFVEKGIEGPKIDLKRSLALSSSINRAELAKDVAAIANTDVKKGYIIIGVLDQSHL